MENPINKSVLITGITGFTGKHLESFLKKKGFKVYGVTFSEPINKNHFRCDILNAREISKLIKEIKPDYLIHLAAISFVATKDISKIYTTNIQGTLNLMEAVIGAKIDVKKAIIASTAAVYGNIGSVLNEEMCPKPVNHYGNSKLAMENMVANYFDKFDIIITRPFNYTGIGQENHFLVPKIVAHYKEKNKVIELGNLNTYREYNDIKFVVESYYKLMLSNHSSEIVNIASGKTYSIKYILESLEEFSGYKIEVKINKKFVRKNEIIELKGSPIKLTKLIGQLDSNLLFKDTLKTMYLS